MSRSDTLRSMLAQDPSNVFARYGLATELKNTGDLEAAIAEFAALLEANPNYSAAFFHGGQTLERLGRSEEARTWYTRGVQAAVHNKDAHAQAEMQAALDLLR